MTGRHNHDGTVTLFAITSTVSANGDQDADPNKLVKVTDLLGATALPGGDGDNDRDDRLGRFVTIRSAHAGEVFRGVALAPRDGDSVGDDQDQLEREPPARRSSPQEHKARGRGRFKTASPIKPVIIVVT